MLTAVPDYIYHIVNCDPSQQLPVMANDGCRNPIMLFEQLRNLSGLHVDRYGLDLRMHDIPD